MPTYSADISLLLPTVREGLIETKVMEFRGGSSHWRAIFGTKEVQMYLDCGDSALEFFSTEDSLLKYLSERHGVTTIKMLSEMPMNAADVQTPFGYYAESSK